jgi:hypothetical protein
MFRQSATGVGRCQAGRARVGTDTGTPVRAHDPGNANAQWTGWKSTGDRPATPRAALQTAPVDDINCALGLDGPLCDGHHEPGDPQHPQIQ